MRLTYSLGLGLVGLALGCSGGSEEPAESTARLEPGVVALVGNAKIGEGLVARVLAARAGEPGTALDAIVHDQLFAEKARAERPDAVHVVERAAQMRAFRASLVEAAAALGPVSADELARSTQKHWVDVDRPRSVRTAHAVALVKSPEDRDKARDLADTVAAAVKGITKSEEFGEKAFRFKDSVPGIELRLEVLPPVAADGRSVPVDVTDPPSSQFDQAFVKGATALTAPGQQSPVVESSFGFHVILALEVIPEKRVDEALRRAMYEGEIFAARADQHVGAALRQGKETTPVEVVRNADELTLQVWTQK